MKQSTKYLLYGIVVRTTYLLLEFLLPLQLSIDAINIAMIWIMHWDEKRHVHADLCKKRRN